MTSRASLGPAPVQTPELDEAAPISVQPSDRWSERPLPVVTRLARAAFVWFFAPASTALAIRLAVDRDLGTFAATNAIASSARRQMLNIAVAAGVVSCLIGVVWLAFRPTRRTVDALSRTARLMAPGLVAVALPVLFDWRAFRDHELLCVATATLFGVALERTLRMSYGALPLGALRESWRALWDAHPKLLRRLPLAITIGLALAFAGYFSYYTVLHHYRLQTQSWDLAIFDNMMWNLLRGRWFKASPDLGRTGSHIQYHATFSAYVFAPFYALRQRADTLLVLQSVFAGLGAIPIYLVAKRRLASAWQALVLAYAYLVYAPLHGPIFYDFHFLTTAPFWIGWVLYFFETRRRGWLIISFILAILLREDQSAGLAMACLFFLLTGSRPWWAISLGLTAAVYFVLVKFVVMPAHRGAGGDKETFTWMFAGLIPAGEGGFGAVIRTVLSNPVFTLGTLLEADKCAYVMKLLAPVVFLPWRHGKAWILLLPAAIFTLLTTKYGPTVSTTFQYTSNWTSFLFFATAVTLGSWRGRPDGSVRIAAALTALAITSTALSYNFGAIFQHDSFRGGFRQVHFHVTDEDRQNRRDLYDLIAMIPKSASVAATETEAPHVCNREDCFTMRFGYDDADYLLVSLDEARGGPSHNQMKAALTTGQYGFVERRGHFALWAKGQAHTRDAEGATLIGVKLP